MEGELGSRLCRTARLRPREVSGNLLISNEMVLRVLLRLGSVFLLPMKKIAIPQVVRASVGADLGGRSQESAWAAN